MGDRLNFIANNNLPGPGLYNLTIRHTTVGFSYNNHKIESLVTINIELVTESLVLAQRIILKTVQEIKGMFEFETLYILYLLNLPWECWLRGDRLRWNESIFRDETIIWHLVLERFIDLITLRRALCMVLEFSFLNNIAKYRCLDT